MPEPAGGDDLYAVKPEQFTAERNALVKRLKAAKRKEDAAEVAGMRRPPPTAWALNQIARTEPGVVRAALEAGEQLRAAMQQAIDGDASGLRDAEARERGAVGGLVDAAAARLADRGQPVADNLRQRMGSTVRAAIIDAGLAPRLIAGTLDGDHDAPGFGMGELTLRDRPVAPRRVDRPERPPAPRQDDRDDREERERARRARADLARLEGAADRLTRRAERLQTEADEAEAKATASRQAAQEAFRQAQEARQAASDAQSKLSFP